MRNQQQSPLFQLPAELRNMIYEYALIEPDNDCIDVREDDVPGLLRTCRIIREEASPMFFGQNRYFLHLTDNTWALEPQLRHWFWTKAEKKLAPVTIRFRNTDPFYVLGPGPHFEKWFEKVHRGVLDVPEVREVFGERSATAFQIAKNTRDLPYDAAARAYGAWVVGGFPSEQCARNCVAVIRTQEAGRS